MNIEEGIKRRQDEKANEIWVGISPAAKECRTCAFAYSEKEHWGGPMNYNCEIYETEDKPTDVLWNGAKCEYHVEDLNG